MVTRRKIDFWNFNRFIAICVLIFYIISHELVANWLAKEVVTTQKWDRSGTPETLGIMPFVKITTTNSLVGGTGLVSNIGGGLGLALGLSILSVMDYFLEKIIPK